MESDFFKTDHNGGSYAGDHILLDLYGAVELDNAEWIERVINKACEIAGAHIIFSKYHQFGEGSGISGATILAESHVSIHTWPEKDFASVDVFMCGSADALRAVEYLVRAFCPTRHDIKHEKRGENFRRAWGQHLILDLKGCDAQYTGSKATIARWCLTMVDAIKMKAYGDPIIEHFASHTPEAAGYTLVQLIETSNICAHFAENTGEAYIDIFSCKPFNEAVAVEVTQRYFKPEIIEKRSMRRG